MWQSGKVALWHFAYFATLPHCHIKVVDNPLSKKKTDD